jgi:hypothetical protein
MRRNIFIFIVVSLLAVPVTFGHSIDYLAASISPASSFNGASGNFTVTDAVQAGSEITFNVTFSIDSQNGTTTYPRTITFGASTNLKPAGAADPVVSLSPSSHTFATAASTGLSAVTIDVPTTPGSYNVKISAIEGTGGPQGLSGGSGIAVNFTVAAPATPSCPQAATSLSLTLSNGGCVYYRGGSITVSASLTSGGVPLVGRTVTFAAGPAAIGSAVTDGAGAASVSYDPSALTVGDYTIAASFDGDSCDYLGSGDSKTLSVQYIFVGFQQPINADGTSVFGGRVIPIKVRITDAAGAAVPNASAHVYFAAGTPAIVGTDAEPVGNTSADSGNAMRYDASADQYIFNWDVNALSNGNYTVRVGLGEGFCAPAHSVVLSVRKKGGK